jgi:hypothetical protein
MQAHDTTAQQTVSVILVFGSKPDIALYFFRTQIILTMQNRMQVAKPESNCILQTYLPSSNYRRKEVFEE